MKFLYTWLILCLAYLSTQAQDKKAIDSLTRIYNTTKYDTTKVLALASIAQEYRNSQPDTCLHIAEKALQISEKIDFEKGKGWAKNRIANAKIVKKNFLQAIDLLAQAQIHLEKARDNKGLAWNYHILGNAYNAQSNLTRAVENYEKAITWGEKSKDKQLVSATLNSIGFVYSKLGNDPLALTCFRKTLKIAEEIDDKLSIANSLHNIGYIYSNQGDGTLALEYYLKALKVEEGIGSKEGIANSLGNIGNIYQAQGKYDLALEYQQKSVKAAEALGDKLAMASSLHNIGDLYSEQGNYTLTMEYYQKSMDIVEELGDKWAATYLWHSFAWLAQKQQAYDKSIAYAQKGLQIAQEIKATAEVKMLCARLYEAYKLKGDYAKALEYHELYKTTHDSLFNTEKAKAIANIETKVEVERKEKEIAVLEKDNQLQKAENERVHTERLAIKKQKEANELIALAKQEKDKRKQDSLYNLAQQRQLEADKFLAQSKTQKLQIQQAKEAKDAQQRVLYVILAGLAVALLLAYLAYRSRQAERRSKEEIAVQAEQLDASNKIKDRLFAILAHDLRNPIMAFQGVAKQVEVFLKKDKPERVLSLVGTIDSYSNNLNNLLDNLLNWALVQRKEITFSPTALQARQEVETCLLGFEALAEARKITLENAVLPTLMITIDKNVLQTIIRNLVSNALKFTPEGGKITVGSSEGQASWQLYVQDTGVGISPEALPALFKVEEKQSRQGIRGEKGIGIGLSLCYELAYMNDLQITVESEIDKGTIFYIM